MLPKYPIYIPSKGRWESPLTAKFLDADGVPFRLVVEAEEAEYYTAQFGEDRVLVLPFSDQGLIASRNWIKTHSIEEGHERHWQLDDNIRNVKRWYKGKRINCDAGPALRASEDFVDRYENIAIAGLNYETFCISPTGPFALNVHVYSCTLVLNSIPHRWRLVYNDDTDICLQVLADGWCTILFNVFMANKQGTMTMHGGNTEQLYQGDGRLRMSRSLERMWPGVVTTERRFNRPQHVIKHAWKRFDTPLIKKAGLVIDEAPNEYGLKLRAIKPVKSERLRKMVEEVAARA